MMFKSIFSKYFTAISLIVVVSFVAMGGMQLFFSSQYWIREKKLLLQENAHNIAVHTANNTSTRINGVYEINRISLAPLLNLLSSSIDATVLITDNYGRILICSEGSCPHLGDNSTLGALLERLDGDEYFGVGTLDNLFPSREYTAGVPIKKDGQQVGYVFTSSVADNLGDYMRSNIQVFLLSALGVLTLTFVVLYAMTYRMVRPLRKMAAATRRFGNGDFSHRIPVQGKDEVAELATALNNMAISLSSVEGMRRSFVANVSHELKTPMTTIAGFIDGILDGTIPVEKQAHYLKIVSDEVKRLSRLVRSMLDLSRIDSGEMKLSAVRFDLTEVVCNALLSFEQRIENKNITVEGLADCPRMEVHGDFDLLGQVLYNLLDNAVKFTNEGGTITLHLEEKDGRVYCTVRNTGPGISGTEMPLLFDRFYKSDHSRSLDKNGVGLGLYIVKSVINLHEGEITVRSVEGQYTEFVFWLPKE